MAEVAEAVRRRMFGEPRGLLGKVGGLVMAQSSARLTRHVLDLLEVGPADRVLDVGFGPGIAVEQAAALARRGFVAGVDASETMLVVACRRNAEALDEGRVDLRRGHADRLPYADDDFDKAVVINSLQEWPDPRAGLRELRRVVRPGGHVAVAFSPYARHDDVDAAALLAETGFEDVRTDTSRLGEVALGRV